MTPDPDRILQIYRRQAVDALGMELESVLVIVEKLGLEPCSWCTQTARMYLT